MFKTCVIAAAACLSISSAYANALHLNPDQPAQSKNMRTYGQTSVPMGAYDFCRRIPDECGTATSAARVKLDRGVWNNIVQVNTRVNQSIEPMTDIDQFGVEENWTLPEYAGDCEDYALEKRRILRQLGIPPGALLMTVGYDEDGGGHAVLTVVTDNGDFILNNTEPRVLRWQDAELTYLKRQSPGDLGRWESLRPS